MTAPAPTVTAEAPPPRPTIGALLKLAGPIIVSRSTQVVIGLADSLMVAGLGEGALAAATAGALNVFAVLVLPMGIMFIVSSFASQLYGKGDLDGARRYGWYGLFLALATQVLCFAGVALTPASLGLLGYAPDVRRMMTEYVQLRLLTGGTAIGIEALANYYGGLGKTGHGMKANVAAMILNVAGNYAFINGHWGAPAMGVKGAALASALSTALAFAGFLGWFLLDGRGVARAKLRMSEMVRMLRFGIPSGLNWFFEFFAFNVFINVVVGGLGTTSLAAMMAVMQINSVSFMPAFGIASAGAILVGQTIGAGRKDDVPHVVKLTFLTSATWQVLVSVSYVAIPALLLRPFTDDTPGAKELIAVGTGLLMLSAGWQVFDSTCGTIAEALRAAGDTSYTMWMRILLAWIVFVPGSYITVRYFHGGAFGAAVWMLIYMALLAGLLLLRFRGGKWRSMELIEPTLVE